MEKLLPPFRGGVNPRGVEKSPPPFLARVSSGFLFNKVDDAGIRTPDFSRKELKLNHYAAITGAANSIVSSNSSNVVHFPVDAIASNDFEFRLVFSRRCSEPKSRATSWQLQIVEREDDVHHEEDLLETIDKRKSGQNRVQAAPLCSSRRFCFLVDVPVRRLIARRVSRSSRLCSEVKSKMQMARWNYDCESLRMSILR